MTSGEPHNPVATVIIPAYNAEAWLTEAVESALAQPIVSKVVLVDDGSATPQANALSPELQADPRLICLRQDNAGVSAARNAGIEHVQTPWMITLDADDVLLAGITDAVDLAGRIGAAVVVSAREERDAKNNLKTKKPPSGLPTGKIIPAASVHHAHAFWGASGQVISNRVLRAGVRYDTGLSIGEDVDFLRQAAPHGGLAISPATALTVRIHPADATNLTGSAHLARRVDDFITLAERWGTDALPPTQEAWRLSWTWLAKRVVRTSPGSPEARRIVEFGRRKKWRLPWRIRLKAAIASRSASA